VADDHQRRVQLAAAPDVVDGADRFSFLVADDLFGTAVELLVECHRR
jgi:hypothetical protein